ncbi:hypothetical protein DFH08DRAFT_817533 [Mycena albidolilacea]|uniref:Uncharacterized protein n=1 Tax=Mycena albidolilacea TaxID=1033008 RepID=A0AAD6ZI21_9AGAR|nr:hypothetical protein DFH08DRAFT_817533 [Mycena albidolilacea]
MHAVQTRSTRSRALLSMLNGEKHKSFPVPSYNAQQAQSGLALLSGGKKGHGPDISGLGPESNRRDLLTIYIGRGNGMQTRFAQPSLDCSSCMNLSMNSILRCPPRATEPYCACRTLTTLLDPAVRMLVASLNLNGSTVVPIPSGHQLGANMASIRLVLADVGLASLPRQSLPTLADLCQCKSFIDVRDNHSAIKHFCQYFKTE